MTPGEAWTRSSMTSALRIAGLTPSFTPLSVSLASLTIARVGEGVALGGGVGGVAAGCGCGCEALAGGCCCRAVGGEACGAGVVGGAGELWGAGEACGAGDAGSATEVAPEAIRARQATGRTADLIMERFPGLWPSGGVPSAKSHIDRGQTIGQFASSLRRAAASLTRSSSDSAGYPSARSSSAAMMASATTRLVNHLRSAGTTYQGAVFVAVPAIAA